MPRRVEAYARAIEVQRFAIAYGLCVSGECIAIAQTHNVERFLRGQHGAMAGTGVVGMAVCDQGLCDRLGRIDMKAARPAAHARPGRHKDILGPHSVKLGIQLPKNKAGQCSRCVI